MYSFCINGLCEFIGAQWRCWCWFYCFCSIPVLVQWWFAWDCIRHWVKLKWATEMFVRCARTCWANNRKKDLFNYINFAVFYLFLFIFLCFENAQENIPTYGGNQTHWWDPRTWPPSYTSERQVHLHFSVPQRRSGGYIVVFLPHEHSWKRNCDKWSPKSIIASEL